jgi:hypothetical protein
MEQKGNSSPSIKKAGRRLSSITDACWTSTIYRTSSSRLTRKQLGPQRKCYPRLAVGAFAYCGAPRGWQADFSSREIGIFLEHDFGASNRCPVKSGDHTTLLPGLAEVETNQQGVGIKAIKTTVMQGRIELSAPLDWPDGTEVVIEPTMAPFEKIGIDESESRNDPDSLAEWVAWLRTFEQFELPPEEARRNANFAGQVRLYNIDAVRWMAGATCPRVDGFDISQALLFVPRLLKHPARDDLPLSPAEPVTRRRMDRGNTR